MEKLTSEEYEQRILELEKVFYNKLNLKNILNENELTDFFQNIIIYLKHGKGKELVGRTPKMLESKIDYFINFGIKVGLNPKEIIKCIEKFPNILNIMDEKFVYKYSFLKVIENEDNTLRKNRLITDIEDFEVSLETMYSRYCLMNDLDYKDINWSNLVHESHPEFIKKFVKGKYYKTYKVYDSADDLTSDKLKEMYPVNYNFIDELVIKDFGGLNESFLKK